MWVKCCLLHLWEAFVGQKRGKVELEPNRQLVRTGTLKVIDRKNVANGCQQYVNRASILSFSKYALLRYCYRMKESCVRRPGYWSYSTTNVCTFDSSKGVCYFYHSALSPIQDRTESEYFVRGAFRELLSVFLLFKKKNRNMSSLLYTYLCARFGLPVFCRL